MTGPDAGPPSRAGGRPPRWAESILASLLPPGLRSSIRADLRERFDAVAEREGAGRARRWYLAQVLSAVKPTTLWALWSSPGSPGEEPSGMGTWVGGVRQDLLHAVRRIRRAPGAALAATVMLAIGVGGGTAVYGLHGAFQGLTRAAVPEPDRVRFLAVRDSLGRLRTDLPGAAGPDLLSAAAPVQISLVATERSVIRAGGEVGFRPVAAVTPGHFGLMGATTVLGRSFDEDDVGRPVLVLAHGFWRDRLGGDPDVLGSVVHVDRRPHTVVGVAAEGFRDVGFVSAWRPLDPRDAEGSGRVTAVVAAGAADEGAGPALRGRLEAALRASGSERAVGGEVRLVRVDDLGSRSERSSISAFFALVGGLSFLVLLAASANVANLGTAQVLARRRELALRLSLGASRARLTRMVVTELLVLGLVAGGAAVAVVAAVSHLLPLWLPPSTSNLVDLEVGPGHLWIGLLLSVVAALLSALLPVLRAPATGEMFRTGPGSTRGEGPGRAQQALVVVQVTLSAVLLASAALLVRSTANLRSLEHGLDPAGTAVFTVTLPESLYTPGEVRAFLEELLPRLEALPGVRAAAAASPSPIITPRTAAVGLPGGDGERRARLVSVSPGYFAAMGTALVAGREPARAGGREAAVTADLARDLWPDGAPLGRSLVVDGREARVVGVAEAGVYGTASEQPHVFLSLDASERRGYTLVLRGATRPAELYPALRAAVARVDPDVPVDALGGLGDLLDRAQVFGRAASGLAGLLAVLAFVIGVVGLYAHFSHHVASRRRAIGVRMALGAPGVRVLGEVLGGALLLTSAGILVGGALATWVGGFFRSFLFGVTPADPVILGAVAAFLALTAAVSVLVPARRAASVEPMVVLREE